MLSCEEARTTETRNALLHFVGFHRSDACFVYFKKRIWKHAHVKVYQFLCGFMLEHHL
jgi:hypothetical protein